MEHTPFLILGVAVLLLTSCRTTPPDPMGAAIDRQCLKELATE